MTVPKFGLTSEARVTQTQQSRRPWVKPAALPCRPTNGASDQRSVGCQTDGFHTGVSARPGSLTLARLEPMRLFGRGSKEETPLCRKRGLPSPLEG
jgi:hypothetical protein